MDSDPNRVTLLAGAHAADLAQAGMPADVDWADWADWALEHPEVYARIQREYAKEGADIIVVFASDRKMAADRLKEAEALVRITRQAVHGKQVAAVMPAEALTGEWVSRQVFDELVSQYKQAAYRLMASGADMLLAWEMPTLNQARAALLGASRPDRPVLVTMNAHRCLDPELNFLSCLVTLQNLGARAVGLAGLSGPAQTLEVLDNAARYAKTPLLAEFLPCKDEETQSTMLLDLLHRGVRMLRVCNPSVVGRVREQIRSFGMLPIPETEDVWVAACPSQVYFLYEDGIELSEPVACGYDLAEDLIKLENQMVNVALLEVTSPDDAACVTKEAHMSRLPMAFKATDEASLEAILRIFPGRSIVDTAGELDKRRAARLARRYGALLY